MPHLAPRALATHPSPDHWRTLRTLVIHLRLPFQLLLVPFFLWGWLLSGGGLSWEVGVAFLAFHVFLYGGATAFNSYYDRDEGPIGGLEKPPPVVPALLPFSLAFKGIGWVLAALVNLPFFLAYGSWVLFSLAYSHPLVRLKGRPAASLLSIGLFQGAVAFLAGWAAAQGEVLSAWSPTGVLGALGAMLMLFGLYPLTQVYQIEEDRARGDRTVAVAWGARACFLFALVCQSLGGAIMVVLLLARFGPGDAVLVGLGLAIQVGRVARWAQRFDERQVLANYRHVMRLNAVSAATLSAYFLARLLIAP